MCISERESFTSISLATTRSIHITQSLSEWPDKKMWYNDLVDWGLGHGTDDLIPIKKPTVRILELCWSDIMNFQEATEDHS